MAQRLQIAGHRAQRAGSLVLRSVAAIAVVAVMTAHLHQIVAKFIHRIISVSLIADPGYSELCEIPEGNGNRKECAVT